MPSPSHARGQPQTRPHTRIEQKNTERESSIGQRLGRLQSLCKGAEQSVTYIQTTEAPWTTRHFGACSGQLSLSSFRIAAAAITPNQLAAALVNQMHTSTFLKNCVCKPVRRLSTSAQTLIFTSVRWGGGIAHLPGALNTSRRLNPAYFQIDLKMDLQFNSD